MRSCRSTHSRGAPAGAELRLWTPPDLPLGADLERRGTTLPELTVEWAGGMVGHPSMYGLLGGSIGSAGGAELAAWSGASYSDSLAGRADMVAFGVSDDRVISEIRDAAPRLVVGLAAEGRASSSALVFYMLACLVESLLTRGVARIEEEVWTEYGRAWAAAREWTERHPSHDTT